MNMFGRKKKGPSKAFSHSENCKIQAADPDVQIEWSEIERGHWVAVCQCGEEHYRELGGDRVRLDPYDPSTFRHAGQCEHRYTSDPALLRVLLKVKEGAGGDYWWVECGACDCGWQVTYFESVG